MQILSEQQNILKTKFFLKNFREKKVYVNMIDCHAKNQLTWKMFKPVFKVNVFKFCLSILNHAYFHIDTNIFHFYVWIGRESEQDWKFFSPSLKTRKDKFLDYLRKKTWHLTKNREFFFFEICTSLNQFWQVWVNLDKF